MKDGTQDRLDMYKIITESGMPMDINHFQEVSKHIKEYQHLEIKIPRVLFSRIRVYCIDNNKDIELFIIEAIEKYLEEIG